MKQQDAIDTLTAVLRQDDAVQAIFLKGSFGRGEEDEHSDIDLYALVEPTKRDAFLARRRDHLATYRPFLLEDEIHIVAPQLIVVYDDLLHLDFFTVTAETLNHQDEIHVLYDPEQRLLHHDTSLALSEAALYDHAFDAHWFFFQYTKAANRGNAIWAIDMLRQAMTHLAYVLAAHHEPERASLGLKDVAQRQTVDLLPFYNELTPSRYPQAAQIYQQLLVQEQPFIATIPGYTNFQAFATRLLATQESHLR